MCAAGHATYYRQALVLLRVPSYVIKIRNRQTNGPHVMSTASLHLKEAIIVNIKTSSRGYIMTSDSVRNESVLSIGCRLINANVLIS